MKEFLKSLFGDAVTDDVLKSFNAELGKKFVAKADFNAKIDEIRALKEEKQGLEGEIRALKEEKKGLEGEIEKLSESVKNGDEVRKELENLKTQIEEARTKADAERLLKEKNESIEKRFNECVGEKKFNHEAIRSLYLKKFGEALESKDFEGKGDSDIFKELTQNDSSAFRGITVVKLPGGSLTTGKTYGSKQEIMAIKDRKERRQAIAENPAFFGIENKS